MIEVVICEEKNGRISAFRVHGHSGTAPKGRDIVCAGVSALAQTALLGLGRHLHREVSYKIDPSGDLQMKLVGTPDDFTDAFGTRRNCKDEPARHSGVYIERLSGR